MKDPAIETAYKHCMRIARSHYENFPLASWFIPARLRRPVSVIYAFARMADDIADEGNEGVDARLAGLDECVIALDSINKGEQQRQPVFIALEDTIQRSRLPLAPFYDLLTAFRMDVTKNRYRDFSDVLRYCSFSANPVGRLILHLHDRATPDNLTRSDAICTSLQLINFLQDIEQDYVERGRVYLPQDEMQQYGVNEDHIRQRCTDSAMLALVDRQVTRILDLMNQGLPLGWELSGRSGFELRMMIYGGLRILEHIHLRRDDVFSRPRLTKGDWCWITWMGLQKHPQPFSLTRLIHPS